MTVAIQLTGCRYQVTGQAWIALLLAVLTPRNDKDHGAIICKTKKNYPLPHF